MRWKGNYARGVLRGEKLTRKREWSRRNTVLYCCIFNICFNAFYPKCAHKMFWVRLRFLIKYFVIKNTYLHLLQGWTMMQHGNSRWKSFCTRGPIAHRWGTKRNEFSLIVKKRRQLPSWKGSSWQPSNPRCVSGFKAWEYSRSCFPPWNVKPRQVTCSVFLAPQWDLTVVPTLGYNYLEFREGEGKF